MRGSSILGGSSSSDTTAGAETTTGNLQNSKMQYIKQMVFQYLVCKDAVVKLHVESALIAMFRFSDHEKNAIEETRRAEDVDTLTSISAFLGLAGTS